MSWGSPASPITHLPHCPSLQPPGNQEPLAILESKGAWHWSVTRTPISAGCAQGHPRCPGIHRWGG